MTEHDKAVRLAAVQFHDAIRAAEAAGFVVVWPYRASGLPTLAVSATAEAAPVAPAVVPRKKTKVKA